MFMVISTWSVLTFHPRLILEMWAGATWRCMRAAPESPRLTQADLGSLWGGACLTFPMASAGPERCCLKSSYVNEASQFSNFVPQNSQFSGQGLCSDLASIDRKGGRMQLCLHSFTQQIPGRSPRCQVQLQMWVVAGRVCRSLTVSKPR